MLSCTHEHTQERTWHWQAAAQSRNYGETYKFSLDDILNNFLEDVNKSVVYPVKYAFEDGLMVILVNKDVDYGTDKIIRDIAVRRLRADHDFGAYLYRHEMAGCPFQVIATQGGMNIEKELPFRKAESLDKAIEHIKSGNVRGQLRVNPMQVAMMSHQMREIARQPRARRADGSSPGLMERILNFFKS